MNVVLIRVNTIKTSPQNPHRRCRVIESVLMNIGRFKTTVSAGLLRQKSKLSKGEMDFATTPRKLSVKATPQPLDAVAVSNATTRPSITASQLCRTAYGYRSTDAADTAGTNDGCPMRLIEPIFDNRPITAFRADRNQGVLLFSGFVSLTPARWMFPSEKAVKCPNKFISTIASKTASTKRSPSISDREPIFYKNQTAESFTVRNQNPIRSTFSGWMLSSIGLAVHADLLRQVVFHLALQG